MPPRVHPPVHRTALLHRPYELTLRTGAMGSKEGVRNAQKALEVILELTIWLLALFLAPCCKNHLVSKAPEYLRLSIPLEILSRVGTLP